MITPYPAHRVLFDDQDFDTPVHCMDCSFATNDLDVMWSHQDDTKQHTWRQRWRRHWALRKIYGPSFKEAFRMAFKAEWWQSLNAGCVLLVLTAYAEGHYTVPLTVGAFLICWWCAKTLESGKLLRFIAGLMAWLALADMAARPLNYAAFILLVKNILTRTATT